MIPYQDWINDVLKEVDSPILISDGSTPTTVPTPPYGTTSSTAAPSGGLFSGGAMGLVTMGLLIWGAWKFFR